LRIPLTLALLVIVVPSALGLEAGAFAVDITPIVEPFDDANGNQLRDPTETFTDTDGDGRHATAWLAGFRMGRAAQSVHDPLWARAVVVRDGKTVIAWVALDLVGYLFHRVAATQEALERELGIPRAHVLVASTHTHHAPDAIGIWGPRVGTSGIDDAYLDRVDAACREAVRGAFARLRPARVAQAIAPAGDLARDSREPKVIDPDLVAMRFTDAETRATIATVAIYGCHPEVLWSKNQAVTSDFPHYLRTALERDLGGVSVFFAGALGGLITPNAGGHDFDRCLAMGEELAARFRRALEGAALEDARLAVATGVVEFPLANLMFRIAMGAGMLPASERMIRKPSGEILLPIEVGAFALGDTTVLACPGELFPELGIAGKARVASRRAAIIGLANMELGYIVPPDAWSWRNYEETMSAGKAVAPILQRAWLDRLRALDRLK